MWIEIDKSTEWGKTLQVKLQKIIYAVHTQAYVDLFGVSSVTVAIATTHERRADLMRSFVQQELQRMELPHLAHLFLFTALPEGLLDPQEVFLSPIWYTPDNNTPVPLLDMSD